MDLEENPRTPFEKIIIKAEKAMEVDKSEEEIINDFNKLIKIRAERAYKEEQRNYQNKN